MYEPFTLVRLLRASLRALASQRDSEGVPELARPAPLITRSMLGRETCRVCGARGASGVAFRGRVNGWPGEYAVLYVCDGEACARAALGRLGS